MKQKTKNLKVVVDRNKWLRGSAPGVLKATKRDVGNPTLVGKMCCLGFACLAAKVSPRTIAGKLMPADLNFIPKKLAKLIDQAASRGHSGKSSAVASNLAATNDSHVWNDAEREKRIISLGKQANIDFVFKG